MQLQDIVCVGLSAAHIMGEARSGEVALGFELPPIEAVWDLDVDSLKVLLPFSLFIDAHARPDSEEKQRIAEISVVLRLEYEVKRTESWSEDDVPHYAGITAYLHAWPYLRAEVQSLTTKLGFPPLVLPVIVSGYAAAQVSVARLQDLKKPPPLPRRNPKKKVAK